MKKKVLLSILTFIFIFLLVGCSSKDKEEGSKNDVTVTPTTAAIEPNTKVGYLRFYAPSDYTYRSDLRGLAYSEAEKKVFLKGDYENNPTGVIYLITALEFHGKDVNEYANEINNKLSDTDVKYTLKTNSKSQAVYARENYEINGVTNYAYLIGNSGDIYVVNIRGPQDKSTEISKLANEVFDSLYVS